MRKFAGTDPNEIKSLLEKAASEKRLEKSTDNLKLIFNMIDLTSLNSDDTEEKIRDMCMKVNGISGKYPGIPNVAVLCVYPSLVHVVKENLTAEGVGIASVAGGFPSSQTFLPVKEMESKLAVDSGASEIDIVISVGRFLSSELEVVSREIVRIKDIIAPAKLKVILETGLLHTPENIYKASMLCLEAGADFIKTSTGKIQPASSPEAVYIMCHALKDFYEKTGKRAGIKPAGGISTSQVALDYAAIVNGILGAEWLNPDLFRIGASRLANNILAEISGLESDRYADVSYF